MKGIQIEKEEIKLSLCRRLSMWGFPLHKEVITGVVAYTYNPSL
jgi:hypothetical protein